MQFISKRTSVLALAAVACAAVSAWAYTVTQSYAVSADGTKRTYAYTVVLGPGETLRDFHLKPPKGKKLKPKLVVTPTKGGVAMGGWQKSSDPADEKEASKTTSVNWYTADDAPGPGTEEEPDTDATDDPAVAGETMVFSVETWGKHTMGDIEFFCTTDGSSTPPTGSSTGTAPGPLAAITPTTGGGGPVARGTMASVIVSSTEDGIPWEAYLSTSLANGPATDPLGIGIDTVTPMPPAFEIALMESAGVFGAPPAPDLAVENVHVNIGAGAPVGTTFYLVVAGRIDGQIELWTEPMEFTVQ